VLRATRMNLKLVQQPTSGSGRRPWTHWVGNQYSNFAGPSAAFWSSADPCAAHA
jgi:hypothetical protein